MANDKDIKIYISKKESEANEFEEISDSIKQNIANGNCDKAKKLGAELAKLTPDENFLKESGYDFTASVLYQIRVLLTFSAEYSIQKNIGNEFLADTASSAMYDYLKQNENQYFKNIADGSAFTFYLLAVGKGGNIQQAIGEEFAQRCSIKNKEFNKFGEKVFEYGLKKCENLIQNADFC